MRNPKPDALRGRVMSVYMTVFAGSTPVGGLLAGWLASSFGSPVALAFGGGASALVSVAAAIWVVRSGHFQLPRARRRLRRIVADEGIHASAGR